MSMYVYTVYVTKFILHGDIRTSAMHAVVAQRTAVFCGVLADNYFRRSSGSLVQSSAASS